MTDRATLIERFLAEAGWQGAERSRVAGDASQRSYDRLTDDTGATAILMDAPPERGEDVRPFIAMARHLSAAGLSAPLIHAQDPDNGLLLIEDFGDAVFARLIRQDPAQEAPLYRAACDLLLALRAVPQPDLTICDADWLTDMIAPLFDWYALETAPDSAQPFLSAFRPLAEEVADAGRVLSLRDYHVENLMLLPERQGLARVGLLDFQDAFLAHPAYDLVSILQDARRDVPQGIESAMLAHYIAEAREPDAPFRRAYALLGLQRNLRIMGVFARLCRRDGKAHYLPMIPRVWGYVQRNLRHPALRPLSPLLAEIVPAPTPAYLDRIRTECRQTATLS